MIFFNIFATWQALKTFPNQYIIKQVHSVTNSWKVQHQDAIFMGLLSRTCI